MGKVAVSPTNGSGECTQKLFWKYVFSLLQSYIFFCFFSAKHSDLYCFNLNYFKIFIIGAQRGDQQIYKKLFLQS